MRCSIYRRCKCRPAWKALPFLILTAVLILTPPGHAAQWQSMTLTEDRGRDMEALSTFCLLHDIDSADVLWANGCAPQDLTAGRTLYLPTSQAEMLAIWQKQGAWKPKALVKTTSAALAERARGTSGYPLAASTPAATPPAPPAASSAPEITRPAPAPVPTPAPARKASQTPQVPARPAPAPKAKATEPVLLLSPEGDAASGPMRLIISKDSVAIVRLPPRATPKTPSLADLNTPFPPSLLPQTPVQPQTGKGRVSSNQERVGSKMMWPVDGVISSPFGPRGKRRHDGVDIPMPPGTPIRVARDGVVAATGTNSTPGFRGYGNFVLVDHGQGIKTLYAHCSKVNVKKGQHLRQGQVIANVGRTGRATTDHVHFEVRVNNKAVNPIPYLQEVRVARKK
ncbi:MAG: M23 family metallopeptidase [Fretibacterium sp.]|nr:M23 family metallopeptidase [Fretibacterium sp.]